MGDRGFGVLPIRVPKGETETRIRGIVPLGGVLGATDREYRTRRRRLLASFLFGPLFVLAGVFFALREGLSFVTFWYLGLGGLLLTLAVADLLGVVRLPIRTREDALAMMARPFTVVALLLIGGAGVITGVVLLGRPWRSSALSFAFINAVIIVMFAYARWWATKRIGGSHAKIR